MDRLLPSHQLETFYCGLFLAKTTTVLVRSRMVQMCEKCVDEHVAFGNASLKQTLPQKKTCAKLLPSLRVREVKVVQQNCGHLVFASRGNTKTTPHLTEPGSCKTANTQHKKQDHCSVSDIQLAVRTAQVTHICTRFEGVSMD